MDYERIMRAEDIESEFGFVLSQAIPVNRKGDVPRIAILREWNPLAPEQIYCSEVVRKGAEILVKSGRPTRVFIRLEQNRWADCGMYRATDLNTDPVAAREATDMTGRWEKEQHGPVWGILHMQATEEELPS